MRIWRYIAVLVLTFVLEITGCMILLGRMDDIKQDTVRINEVVKSIETGYGNEALYDRSLDYAVLNEEGEIIFKTEEGLPGSVNEAVKNGDTILDITLGSETGKILIRNTISDSMNALKKQFIFLIASASAVQAVIITVFLLNIKRRILDPFRDMNEFAVRVAGGDLDLPLKVDEKHVFGEFTEAFDLMRTELKRARASEKKANDDKKEIVAKLSHDIKTPVASIKSASEVGYELTREEKTKEFFNQINVKADQIKVLTDNLFNSSVQDITDIPVNPSRFDSGILTELVRNADYLRRSSSFDVPECEIYIDKLRLQQTLDNIFVNSYKYANTDIEVSAKVKDDHLILKVSDKGPGVKPEELPLLKEKYKRGGNSSSKEGAGLGLYLADYFMTNMDGRLEIRNEDPGLSVSLYIRIV